MNKVMVAAILSGLAGAGCYFAFGQTILSAIPLLSTIPSQIPNVIGYIQENLAAVGIGAGTMLTLGAIAVRHFLERAKSNVQEAATQKINEAQNQALEIASENQSLHQTLTQLQTENTILKEANQDVTQLQQKIKALEDRNLTVTAQRNQLQQQFDDKQVNEKVEKILAEAKRVP